MSKSPRTFFVYCEPKKPGRHWLACFVWANSMAEAMRIGKPLITGHPDRDWKLPKAIEALPNGTIYL